MSNKKCHIHLLPHGRQIEAKSGRSLMESLMDKSIFLRSDCGGKGVCKKCKVKVVAENGDIEFKKACKLIISEDISIEIPEISMLSSHIITKAAVSLPVAFKDRFKTVDGKDGYGIAVDLGTTTIAVYLCNTTKGKVLSSLAVKNPQALYGDDIMSRISAIGQEEENLGHLQKLVVRAIEWGIKELLASLEFKEEMISQMVTVGNPTMIHIFAGVDPKPIGVSPYQPAFYEAKNIQSSDLGFKIKGFSIQLLPQVSGFIGGDILSATLAVDLENQPVGTLLVDLGTNGELMLKGKDQFFATSCATGPAFEGATLSCGMQAIPGAINKVQIKSVEDLSEYTIINPSNSFGLKPSGICGTGVISAVTQFCQHKIIDPGGAFQNKSKQYIIVPENFSQDGSAIFISQKDIRSVQLGKGALITGIEFLLKEAGLEKPEKIIIAGAFGSFLDKKDMMALGMIPAMDLSQVEVAGNSAGAGAIMTLCDTAFLDKAIQMANKVIVVDLACNQDFQDVFVKKLGFPIPGN
ncbi:MAG: ASKHA domain-containing protein [Desulfobacula sp.]|uniref:ASKHA domain-containing protein n=1 Tax=Desulfobacula sp. TaxID=2593537 RepID=UPI0025B945BE|nr:ASKHA domain-containing protein [Desulfobacula sp.]MCD4720584.1 ASKHA domain-containing protein [Desulfobacula sp.]